MNPTSQALKELHGLLLALEEARRKLRVGPRQIQTRQQAVDEAAERIEAAKEEVKRLKMLADQKSLQLTSNESKIADLKIKLNSITTNREYEALKEQIEADRMANSVLEDEILETLELADEAAVAVEKAIAAHGDAVKAAEQLTAKVESDRPKLKEKVADLEAKITAAEPIIPPKLRNDYTRMANAGGPDAMAPSRGDSCDACFLKLSPQLKVDLKSGKVVACGSCGRILYFDDE